jgi:phosphatidate phosphatase APP1
LIDSGLEEAESLMKFSVDSRFDSLTATCSGGKWAETALTSERPILLAWSKLLFELVCPGRIPMKDWKSKIGAVLGKVDELSDTVRARLKRFSRFDSDLKIIPYVGFGNAGKLIISGRVVNNESIASAQVDDSPLENLFRLYKRLETDEVPGAHVRARYRDLETDAVADEEGYFSIQMEVSSSHSSDVWRDVELELLHPQTKNSDSVTATGRALVPPGSARFGIISDIDDTIIQTNVVNKLRMVLTVALTNERTRLPFEGVAGLYQALQRGSTGNDHNPIFYVSSSPWNLYEPLVEFLDIHGIPLGPLFLRDYGDHTVVSATQHQGHKIDKIETVLNLYPELQFLLIGDSGEQDPEIYAEAVRRFPTRIRVIYIRNVDPRPERLAAIERLVGEVRNTGCQLVLVPDSESAATHAAGEGLLLVEALSGVRAQRLSDEQSTNQKAVAE